jgi:hypothetical protein
LNGVASTCNSTTTTVLGCTDAAADNFDALATTDDGSCTYSGCTDASADNYDALATTDDGSCAYTITITTTVCTSADTVRLTGPWWSWDPNGGPIAR